MKLTAYCLSYGNWTVIPHQWRESFMEMRDSGFDAVALSFSESEMRYARRTIELQVKYAHDCGLEVYLIPSRLGGRMAGAPLMPSSWLSQHPECALPEIPFIACVESAAFREWFRNFVVQLVCDYEIEGIIWDEPKFVDFVTVHPETLARFGANPTPEQMMDSLAGFLGEVSQYLKKIRPELSITMFNMPSSPEYFTRQTAGLNAIDYCGFDGSCGRQSYFHEPPEKLKPSLNETWQRTIRECAMSGAGTFALIENMLIPREVHDEFRENLMAFLNHARPDHLSCYYYGHNNEKPEVVQKITMETIATILSESDSKGEGVCAQD